MKIKILAFGVAQDIVGARKGEMDVTEEATIAEVKAALSDRFPRFEALNKFSIAVNEEYREDDYIIQSGDELAIIPPVSGG